MKTEMIFSGFGGQGALTIGKFIAQSALTKARMFPGIHHTCPEMRGGTAK
jgi:2-oxoglutarate ferredoxin oxidoreductase subunit gamma